jgi:hypothetical protein
MQRIERNNNEKISEKKLVESKLIERMHESSGLTGASCSSVSSMTASLPEGCKCSHGSWTETNVMGLSMYGCK